MVADLRYAVRQLRRAPGFAATAVLTLALGLGATAAVYTVVQAVLLSPLPYADADRLVGVAFTFPGEKPNAEQTGVSADFVREHSNVFAATAVMDDGSAAVNLSVAGGHAVQVNALRVSEGYFRTLGAMPAMGRVFTADEDRHNGPKAAILSDGLWRRAFGGDRGIVGRDVRVNQENFTVVGVMPAAFKVSAETAPGVEGVPEMWLPLQLSPHDPGYMGDNYMMIARLRDGVSLAQSQQQMTALEGAFYAELPNFKSWVNNKQSNQVHDFKVWPLKEVVVAGVRQSLEMVLGAVLAVLLVACLNLAGLMMARAMRRARELALRTALGATRTQLVRLVMAEGAVIALTGGALGVVVARVCTGLLLDAAPLAIPRLQGEPGLGLTAVAVLAFAAVSTLVFAVVPGWIALRGRGSEARLNGPTVGETAGHARVSRVLLVAQVALAMVLVSVASVLLGTFVKLRSLPSGVEAKQLAVFQVTLKGERYASTQRTLQFVNTVLEQMRRTPGVDGAAAVNGLPLDRGLNEGGSPAGRRDLAQTVEFRAITPGYFAAMGMPVLAGRDVTDADGAGADRVALVGATAAKKWWPGRSAVGESVRVGGENMRIIGVVPDVQQHSLVEAQGVVVYGALAQLSDEGMGMLNGWFPTTFVVRTAAHVNLAQTADRAVQQADAEIPVARFTTMQSVIDSTIKAPRFFSLLASGFSGFALVLTVIGLFGLLSYQVTQRTREIGVRMALGADRMRILRGFLGRGVALAATGVVLGSAVAALVRPVVMRLIADMGVGGAGRHVVMNGWSGAALAACAVLVVAVVASWLPARRAALVEPMQALRTE